MKFIKRYSEACVHCETGVASIEFGLAISMLLIMLMGCIEVTRYVLIVQKLEKTVVTVANVVTQTNPDTSPLTDTIMQSLMSAVQDMMSPYGTRSNMRVIVTDVVDETNSSSPSTAVPTINWQFCGGGTLTNHSKLGTSTNTTANLSGTGGAGINSNYTMISGEEAIIAEAYFNFQPIVSQNIISGTMLYRTAVFLPRFGALTAYSPNSTISNASNCP